MPNYPLTHKETSDTVNKNLVVFWYQLIENYRLSIELCFLVSNCQLPKCPGAEQTYKLIFWMYWHLLVQGYDKTEFKKNQRRLCYIKAWLDTQFWNRAKKIFSQVFSYFLTNATSSEQFEYSVHHILNELLEIFWMIQFLHKAIKLKQNVVVWK